MDTVQYPLPSVEDVIMNMGNSRVFSKVDLHSAYLQIPLDEKSKEYTTVNTTEGLFRYNFLPFGVSSSPALFQSFMCQILSGVKNIIVYQDDILIMTETKSHHDEVLNEVLSRLKKAGLKVNSNKCKFYVNSVQYLGHIFDANGVRVDTGKMRAILDAPHPTKLSQVQSFIGMCNFYRRFIPNFSDAFAPLYALLKKGAKFEWNDTHTKCFNMIKELFTSSKVLRRFVPTLPIAIESDASSLGIGACLMQRYDDGWYPVQFASRMLNEHEINYSQIEREALSVIFACEKFRYYLLGNRFIIKNDHKPLLKLFDNKQGVPTTCSARLIRWALRLSQFMYTFQYIKGSDNVNSDFLSRLPLQETIQIEEPYELIFVVESLDSMPITCGDIAACTDADEELRQIKQYIKYGFPVRNTGLATTFKNLSNSLSIMKGCIMNNDRVYIPQALRSRVMDQFHDGHPGMTAMKQMVRSLIWYPGIDKDVEETVKSCQQCINNRNKPSQKCHVEWEKTSRVFSRIHIDHFEFEKQLFLLVIDSSSKYIECEIAKSTSASETIDLLTVIFSRHGLPDTVVSDNAPGFKSEEFISFLTSNGIHHTTPPPYSPASNGQAERAVETIKRLLKKNTRGSMRIRLANVLLYYRNAHSGIQMSPSVALNLSLIHI